ncbi:hypothetical protein PoB_007356400 [Plakobranchus ocellatus]|uniref:Uncharacterized protein n=1 Tax=Plakobranchus ocellatus TaxID=259542 RepID=A0AAV4DSA6_9GAST|nr:hypothetical protein PoB_007356400 [Plakobranchus ocellatus]
MAPMAGLEPATEGFRQISGQVRHPLYHRRPRRNGEDWQVCISKYMNIKKKASLASSVAYHLLSQAGLAQNNMIDHIEYKKYRAKCQATIVSVERKLATNRNGRPSTTDMAHYEEDGFSYTASPEEGNLRLPGPPSDQGAGVGARTRDRRVPADLRAILIHNAIDAP